ncbi:MAG: hypothetical protein QOK11_2750, partial [Pseudonocardiales bacterium]|nr:hypothetical protein [Pseudonocardiales bacterium]
GGFKTDIDLGSVTARDGRDLLAVAESDWSRPIPHCPSWDAADLIGHTGGILAWMALIVATGQPVARHDRETPPPELSELSGWHSAHLERTLQILTTTDSDATTWTFSSQGDRRVSWWRRRLAVELAIHRWDAEDAARPDRAALVHPVDTAVAAAGVEEFLTEVLPGLLAHPGSGGLVGSLHLHATDGPSDCWIDLDAGPDVTAIAGHVRADTVIRATQSDLLLWLTNRAPTPSIEILGASDVAVAWTQLRR